MSITEQDATTAGNTGEEDKILARVAGIGDLPPRVRKVAINRDASLTWTCTDAKEPLASEAVRLRDDTSTADAMPAYWAA
jgi:hypothetical protein